MRVTGLWESICRDNNENTKQHGNLTMFIVQFWRYCYSIKIVSEQCHNGVGSINSINNKKIVVE